MKNIIISLLLLVLMISCKTVGVKSAAGETETVKLNNPIITDQYTGDPAALVYKDKVYLYAGHDEAPNDFNFYKMNEWVVYSSSDMKHWESHPVPLKVTDFKWASNDAFAGNRKKRKILLVCNGFTRNDSRKRNWDCSFRQSDRPF
ncbi:MAG: hypothetical protein ABI576_02860 [Flavobacterium sp.]